MFYSAIVIAAFLAFYAYLFYKRRKDERLFLVQIRNGWGKEWARERDFNQIATYHSLKSQHTDLDKLDNRTWDDLNMNEIFAKIDHTVSPIGQQYLYHVLRTPKQSEPELLQRNRLFNLFATSPTERERLQRLFHCLNEREAFYLPHFFLKELAAASHWQRLTPILAIATVLCMLLVYFSALAIVPLLLLTSINTVSHFYYHQKIQMNLASLRSLKMMIGVGNALSEIKNEHIGKHLTDLRHPLSRLRKLERWLRSVVFDHSNLDELSKTFLQIVNIVTLFEVSAFVLSLEIIRQRQDDLHEVFTAIGYLEVTIAIASFRAGFATISEPQFTAPHKTLSVENIYHPLLTNPVANSLSINGQGMLVTGSNMSGKTTFIRTLGVNAVLAQTIYTTFAQSYQAPFLKVRCAIGRADNLLEGKSYYLAEVEATRKLVKAAERNDQCLFILDELLRGTNTIERIAAGKAVLEHLNQKNHLVLATTHDNDLGELLNAQFECYHFQESVADDELSFDYKLRSGITTTRNAIALLAISGYPKAVIQSALEAASLIEGKGR